MSQPAILSLGSVNADFQVRTPRPLAAGETLLATDFVRLGGGKAANVAFLAHRLGHPATLLGRVGDDDLCDQALAPLRRAGLALDGVSVATGHATAVSMIAVAPDAKKSIVLASNANDAWDDDAVRRMVTAIQAAPEHSILAADFEIPPNVAARAIAAARARGLRVLIDPAPASRADRGLLGHGAILCPDALEAAELTGIDTGGTDGAARAATALAGLGASLACVKLGDGGCVFRCGDRLVHIPPVPVRVVDSTGAGDAFAGALAVALLEDQASEAAVLFATAASHLAVTRYGSQESYPTRAEIDAFVPRLAEGVRALGR